MAAKEADKQQTEIATRLQLKLLELYEKKLDDMTISDTGMGNLQRLLSHNGWSLDPAALPEKLRGKLLAGNIPIDENELPDNMLTFRKPA
jgi:hypothetical protein